jgi:hypothetical protein
LCENRGVIVHRAVAEVEQEARGDTIAVYDLRHVAGGEALAFESFQDDKAMRGALGVADRDGIGVQTRSEQRRCQDKDTRSASRKTAHG